MRWKQYLAATGYAAIVMVLLMGAATDDARKLLLGFEMLVVVLLATNAWGLRSYVPALTSPDKWTVIKGWAALVGIGLIAFAIAAPPAPKTSAVVPTSPASEPLATTPVPSVPKPDAPATQPAPKRDAPNQVYTSLPDSDKEKALAEGLAAYRVQDYGKALSLLRPLAEQGYAEAQACLGEMYRYGKGVPTNDAEGVKWYRKAAEQGHREASQQLVIMGTPPIAVFPSNQTDRAKREAEGQNAAEITGDQRQTGISPEWKKGNAAYEVGNYGEAFRIWKAAAENNDKHAQYSLGVLYYKGQEGERNVEEALKWFRRAAENGQPQASYVLGKYYGSTIDSTGKFEKAEAAKWFRLGANQGHPGAQYELGFLYSLGGGVPKDEAEAVRWYQIAAENGSINALWRLGDVYEHGKGVAKDEAEAVKWYRKGVMSHIC